VRSLDDLPVRGDHIGRTDRRVGRHDPGELRVDVAGRDRVGDVVHAREQDEVGHARRCERVAVEPGPKAADP